MNCIEFSHNGWMSIISDEFTFNNLRLVTQAICNYFRREQNYIDNFPPRLAIGYDTRFLGETYADEVAKIVVYNGFDAYLSDRPSPTPSVFWAVKTLVLTGGIMLTAGDMPFEYNGVKISTPQGAIVPEKVTQEIEDEMEKLSAGMPNLQITPGQMMEFNPRHYYFHQLASIVSLPKIAKAGIDITIDCLYGSSSGYLKDLLFNYDCMAREINNYTSYDFNKTTPNLSKKNLSTLQQTVLAPRANLQAGFAIDGDGSKIKAVDISGASVSEEALFAILIKHLVENRETKRGIVKPEGEGKLIDKLAQRYNIPVFEIKGKDSRLISEIMQTNDCMIGTSLNGDFHINLNHILDKDGLLAILLTLEAMASFKQNLNYIYGRICDEVAV